MRRDRAPHSEEARKRRRLRRDGGVPPRAGSISWSPRARTRARGRSLPGSIAARVGRIRRDARFSRCSPAPSNSCRRDGSPNTSRSRRCPRLSEPRAADGIRRPASTRNSRCSETSRLSSRPPIARRRRRAATVHRDRRGRRRARIAAGALEVGDVDRRIRRHRRRSGPMASAARRPGERVSAEGSPPNAATIPDSPRAARLERDLRNLGHLRSFALPIIDRLASWPATAAWGEWLDRFAALAPTSCGIPIACCASSSSCGRWSTIGPVSLEEARDVVADRLLDARRRPAAEPLRPRVRRQPAAGARPHIPRGVRRRPGRAHVSAAAARGSDAARRRDARAARRRPRAAGGSRTHRTPAAAPGRRRRDRAPVALVSADRRRGVASARAQLLCAGHHARDHRPHSAATRSCRRGRGGERRAACVARAGAQPTRRSTISSTISSVLKQLIADRAARRPSAARRTTCCD